jgi:predicted GNAT family N-acyltransferase
MKSNAIMNASPDFLCITGSWAQLAEDARPIRYEVFVLEQQVPLELEWDEMDESSLHIVAYDKNRQAIGTARLLPDGHIGRMAVRQPLRGKGVGSVLLQTLVSVAQQRGDAAVLLHAQLHAEDFYRRHGFVRDGEEFVEAGIMHICMRHDFKQ